MSALETLITTEYIHWEDKTDTANIVILEGWERDSEKPSNPVQSWWLPPTTRIIGPNIKEG